MLNLSQATRFSFSVSSELFSVQGRALPSPDLDSGSPGVHETQNGEWDLKPARKFAKSCPAATWSYLDFTGRKSEITASKSSFIDDLRNGVKTWCPKLTESKAKIRTVDFPKADPKELEKILRQYRPLGIQPIHTDILFVGLRDDNADNYELLKYVAEVVVGIHTICTIKCKTAVVANLMLKCNLKLGGDNWVLSKKNRNQVPNFLSSTTMIVGADVTHPGPGSMDDVDSVAAVVANEDNAFNRYPASFRCQASKMEMIDQFDDMVAERLDHWKKSNGGHQYPSNIIIYRDGVSESQFEKVLELEYPQIESVIERLYNAVPQKIPGVMMLSVQKRHHTRFYPEKAAQKDENGNAYPGLLVDRGVTYADKYNWFLQSHRSILGTARPAHYVVLVNTINADMDEVHKAVSSLIHFPHNLIREISSFKCG
jgi:eukaryotic translation initiation factor 2C